jgi:transcription-repair coupling factor (superfamily II helicase)
MNFLNNIFANFKSNNISGLTDELKILYINYLSQKNSEKIIVLTSNLYQATKYYDSLKTYTDECYLFPMDEFFTSVAIAVSPDLKVKRLETLNAISNKQAQIIITNLTGFLKFVPTSQTIQKLNITLSINQQINRQNFEELLDKFGYNKSSIVTSSGEYSVRGFVIDLFPYNFDTPIRIELFGNMIENIKKFDPESQLSFEQLKNVEILPFDEIATNDQTSLYDLLDNPTVIKIDSETIMASYRNLQEQIINYKAENNIEKSHKYMFTIEEIPIQKEINLSTFNNQGYFDIKTATLDNFNTNFNLLKTFIEKNITNKVIIFSITNQKTASYLQEIFKISKNENYQINNIYLINAKINNGFIIDKYIVITDNDIENKQIKTSYYNSVKIGRKIKDFNEIKQGDYVVHQAHGIGIYNGVTTLSQNGILKDYILIKYAGNDKVYVPVEKISTIFKYSDADGTPPKINQLNSPAWAKTKKKVKAKVKDISQELLNLYAERSKIKSPKFKEFPEDLIFANNFEYTETKDQTKCIKDVLQDLRSDKPMDRLLCGDVGFGKTEVAFRAIFNTIMNGYQVAYLCPTTILSKQQYTNAVKRFSDFPINIAIVNRFTSTKEFNDIVHKLQNGQIDLIFGTHKLFNKNISYKNLGLLVVDEEQRFGVSQKEKIKEITKNINVLTLSATPIPRTLKMAMSGLKDLSILDTAPENRYPVQTYVVEQSDMLIKEAIYKELSRNGQIFYLYNNVEKIENEVSRLKKLIPEAKICYAHGQMEKHSLEKIIEDFVNQKYDILVCTTIIETGIDISNVNTLIIIDAQNYGLSQLYQLRGRVGRSNKIAYAYLTYNNHKILNEIATKRLNAIKEFTELGSGYKIAMRDLAIRGAGDILGSEQAGFIDTVGIEMFTTLIEEAINELKGTSPKEDPLEKSLLNVDTHIDQSYVSDESVRIEIHQLINEIKDYASLTKIKTEIEDRFGKIDDKIEIYMYEEWFEKLAIKLNITKVIQTKTYVEIYLPSDTSAQINGEKLFLKIYNINPKFSLRYFSKEIIIKIPTINLEKHYLYYLVELLEEILNDIE